MDEDPVLPDRGDAARGEDRPGHRLDNRRGWRRQHQSGAGRRFGRRRRPTVGTYLLLSFGVSLLVMGAVTSVVTVRSLADERRRAAAALEAAARREIERLDDNSAVKAFFAEMVENPAVRALDPPGCQAVFEEVRKIADINVHLLRADGSVVCGGTTKRGSGAIEPGPWLAQTLASPHLVTQDPAIDPSSGEPVVLTSLRVMGPAGPVGAVAALVNRVHEPIPRPVELPDQASIFVVDASRSLVLATTEERQGLVGTRIRGLLELAGDDVWGQATGRQTGWHALAVVPRGVAEAHAYAQLRRMVVVGLTGLAGLAGPVALLHRRLVRPRWPRRARSSTASSPSSSAPRRRCGPSTPSWWSAWASST